MCESMKLVYVFSSKETPMIIPENEGLEEVPELLEELKKRGIQVELVDTAKLDESEVEELYLDAVGASVVKKYRIRQVFGTRRQSAIFFGKKVPALLVYEGDTAIDVYPHQTIFGYVTTRDYLKRLLSKLEKEK